MLNASAREMRHFMRSHSWKKWDHAIDSRLNYAWPREGAWRETERTLSEHRHLTVHNQICFGLTTSREILKLFFLLSIAFLSSILIFRSSRFIPSFLLFLLFNLVIIISCLVLLKDTKWSDPSRIRRACFQSTINNWFTSRIIKLNLWNLPKSI